MPEYIQLSLFSYIPSKNCARCKRELPATPEFWHVRLACVDHLDILCKQCVSELAHMPHIIDPDLTQRERRRAYRERNHDRILAQKRSPAYKAKAAELRRRKAKELREYNRRYALEHPGWKARVMRIARQKYPERYKAIIHKRIALKNAAPGEYIADDVKRMYAEQDGMCAYCGIRIFMDIPKDVHVDHVLPLSRGGTNYPDNLLLTCSTCNQSKGGRTVTEWASIRGW
jgi:5-methylcytosine-specific restriction endonuclease McrA